MANETIKVFFWGVDSWHRAVFRQVGSQAYWFASHPLLDANATEQEALDRVIPENLSFYGWRPDTEPQGGNPTKPIEIVPKRGN